MPDLSNISPEDHSDVIYRMGIDKNRLNRRCAFCGQIIDYDLEKSKWCIVVAEEINKFYFDQNCDNAPNHRHKEMYPDTWRIKVAIPSMLKAIS